MTRRIQAQAAAPPTYTGTAGESWGGRRRGFWLVELLILLGMLGLIALAGGRLFSTAIRLGHDSAQAANAAASFDALDSVLRHDVWSAREMAAGDDGAAATLNSGEKKITWTIHNETLTRDDGQGTRTWPISAGSAFTIDGPSIVLRLPATRTFRGGEVRWTSQAMLLARRPA